jgi:hypothetical protein
VLVHGVADPVGARILQGVRHQQQRERTGLCSR